MSFMDLLKKIIPQKTRTRIRQFQGLARRFFANLFIRATHFSMMIIRPFMNNQEFADAAIVESYKSRHGQRFIASLDRRDEMYKYFNSVGPGKNKTKNQEHYFLSGQKALVSFKNILADQGISYKDITSLLEFASGYGRITRFLVTRIAPQKITVSDIDSAAVQFNSTTFGTSPLVSSENPSNFICDRKFQLVFVASLFTHLNHALWVPWLKRLYELLEPGGLLIFSTRNLQEYSLNDYIEFVENGFAFEKSNETLGRLKVNIYGTTLVTQEWVRKTIQDHGLGELMAYYPRKLWQQDIYVIKKTHLST
jgi:SAM-dependent methyltransferase